MHEQIQQQSSLPGGTIRPGPRDPNLESEERQRVCEELKGWLATPYHHQAFVKGPKGGVDCAFFLICVYNKAGLIPWIDPRPYTRDWHMHRDAERYLGWVKRFCGQVESPLPGDLVVFQYGRTFSHAGIVIDWPLMMHSYVGIGVTYADATRGEFAVMRNGSPRPKEFYSLWRTPDNDT